MKIKVSVEEMKVFLRKIGILGGDKVVTLTACRVSESKMLLQGTVVGNDKVTQMLAAADVASVPKDAGVNVPYMQFATPVGAFNTMVNSLLLFGEDIVLEEKNGVYSVKTSSGSGSMKLDVVEPIPETVSVNAEMGAATVGVSKAEFMRLFKDAGKYCKLTDETGLQNAIFTILEGGVKLVASDGLALGYGKAAAEVRFVEKANEKEEVEGEEEVVAKELELAIPGVFIPYITSVCNLSSQETILLFVDDKYLHIRYEQTDMLSLRLGASKRNFQAILEVAQASFDNAIAVDKACFEHAVKMLTQRLALAGEKNVGIRMESTKKGLKLSCGGNNVAIVKYQEDAEEVEVDRFLMPDKLSELCASLKPGTMVLGFPEGKGMSAGNGDKESGVADGSTLVFTITLEYEAAFKALCAL